MKGFIWVFLFPFYLALVQGGGREMLLRFHFRFCFRSVLKASLIALVLIVISLQTDGSCPKNCNGHGECSPYSSTRGWGTVNNGSATCECQANYRGPDCSISKSLVFFFSLFLIHFTVSPLRFFFLLFDS